MACARQDVDNRQRFGGGLSVALRGAWSLLLLGDKNITTVNAMTDLLSGEFEWASPLQRSVLFFGPRFESSPRFE